MKWDVPDNWDISTHSLTKRLTQAACTECGLKIISTHSLTKRLTGGWRQWVKESRYFNSQPHEEADRSWSSSKRKEEYFNSQPHEEADYLDLFKVLFVHFNSQPHEEADVTSSTLQMNIKFQLTASRRGWQRIPDSEWLLHKNFNSQPHEEADENGSINVRGATRFQLTASRRGWRLFSTCISGKLYFNSQPHEEADWKKGGTWFTEINFNSQPHEEADWEPSWMYCGMLISTHSLTKRLTGTVHDIWIRQIYFNSQPHEEADLFDKTGKGILIVISTHSLTKRLTMQDFKVNILGSISTHSLTKRLTPHLNRLERVQRFQLTASRRGWQQF